MLKDELKWIPFYGWFCLKFEHILVRRDRAAAALKAMLADSAIPFEFVSRRRYGRIWRGVQEKQERTSGGKAVNLWPPPEWFEA